MSDNGEEDDQPLKRQKIEDHDTLPDPPAVDVEEIGSQDTDDEEHSANAEIEDDFLQVLDQLDDNQKAKLVGTAIEEYGKKLFINHEEQRDDLLFAALQLDGSFVDLARAIKFQSEVVDVEDEDDDGEDSQDDDQNDQNDDQHDDQNENTGNTPEYASDEDDQQDEDGAGGGEDDGEEGSVVEGEDDGEEGGAEDDGEGDGGEED